MTGFDSQDEDGVITQHPDSTDRSGETASTDGRLQYLVTMSEIADLYAHGSRSTASNWRERFPTFPHPVTHGRTPVFDVDAVMRWAASADSPVREPTPPTDDWRWRKAAEALRIACPDAPLRPFLGALVLVQSALVGAIRDVPADRATWLEIEQSAEPGGLISAAAADLERRYEQLTGLLVDPLSDHGIPDGLLVEVLRRLEAAGDERNGPERLEIALGATMPDAGRGRNMYSTAEELAELLARLGEARPGDVVLDPAMGEGGVLLAVARSAGALGFDIELYGQELDRDAWQIAATRLLLGAADAHVGVPEHDSIREDLWPDVSADVVLLDPPYGHGAPELRKWLAHAIAHLAPDGRAVFAVPAHAIVDVSSARRLPDKKVREALVDLAKRGLVESVVVLPRRVRSDVAGPLTVWVIRQSAGATDDILLVEDVSATVSSRASSQTPVVRLDVDAIVAAVSAWRASNSVADGRAQRADATGVIAEKVPAGDLVRRLSEGALRTTSGSSSQVPSTSGGFSSQELAGLRRRHAAIGSAVSQLRRALDDPTMERMWDDDPTKYFAVRDALANLKDLVARTEP
ncbi:MAG: SAM-dependent methyltransferase [Actinomycetota bacterium]|nr:SAM-dependent methyltransferase [Actinomycetota bacterium]